MKPAALSLPVPSGRRRYVSAAHACRTLAIVLLVFYPFKGLVSAPFFFLFGDQNAANYLNPTIALTVAGFVVLSFLANSRPWHFSRLDLLLIIIGAVLFAIAILRLDIRYAEAVALLFIVPLMVAHMAHAGGAFIQRTVTIYFGLGVAYIAVEHILLNTHTYGLTDNFLISVDALSRYQDALSFGRNADVAAEGTHGISILDFRTSPQYDTHPGLRTGGFLSNLLVMPTLISMAGVFFYVSYRQSRSRWLLVAMLVAAFNVMISLSTTGIMAFALTAIFYELYYRKGSSRFVVPLLILGVIALLITYFDPVSFVYRRFLDISDQQTDSFTFASKFSWAALGRALMGWHSFDPARNDLSTNNGLLNLITAVGVVPAFFLAKRLLGPIPAGKKLANPELVVYSMVVLDVVIAMTHDLGVFNVNIFPMAALLNMRCHAVIRTAREQAKEARRAVVPGASTSLSPART